VGSADFGVAKGVRLVAVRVLDCNGSGLTSDVIAGVDYVTGNHAAGAPAVANMSLGGGASPALDNAVKSSIAAGVTYVLAAGNDAADACGRSPGRVPAALTVGATNSADQEASFSNYGSCVDLLAPGVGITSTWSTSDVATNTISGTSMAAPHVAGVAALYLEQAPGASPATVHGAVVSGSTANSLDLYDGLGTPNRLVYSLIAPVTPPPPPPAPAPPAPPPAAVIEWTAPAAVINRTAPAAVIDGTAPAAALSGSKTQTLGRNVRVRVSCPDEACVVTAGGTVRVPTIGAMNAKAYKLKKTATAVTKGGKAMLAATLPSAAQAAIKRALRRGLRITVKLEITTADAAGNSTTLARQVKLKL
jgi:subtilisin family serine protease